MNRMALVHSSESVLGMGTFESVRAHSNIVF